MKRDSVAVILLTFAFCRSVSAEPITAGSMVYVTPPPSMTISISGDRFAFDGAFNLSEHLFAPNENCRFGLCHPGASINFGGVDFRNPDVGGTFTLDGRTFAITSSSDRPSLRLSWNATLVAPSDLSPGLVTVTAPFSLTGSFTWFDIFANDPSNPHIDFSGNGILTANFDYRNFEFPGQSQLFLHSARYDFAEPTPEPGTLLLFATGLAGVVGARRGRRVGIGSPRSEASRTLGPPRHLSLRTT